VRLEQVGLKRQGSAGFFDGAIHRVEVFETSLNPQREDVGKDGVPQTIVLVELDGFFGIGFAFEVLLLEALRPAREGVGFGDGVVEQDGVLGIDLRLDQLIGVDLQARDFEVVGDVLRVGVDRALVGLDRLEILALCCQRVSFSDERLGIAGWRGGGDEGWVHHRDDDHVEVD